MLKRMLLLAVFVLFLLPAQAQEKADSLYEFHFVPQKDMFFVPYWGNHTELERLLTFVEQHRAAILQGEIPLLVDGSCGSSTTPKENKAIARRRANRVKSELITRSRLTENCFVTRITVQKGELVTVRAYAPVVTVAGQPEKEQTGDDNRTMKPKEPETVPVETASQPAAQTETQEETGNRRDTGTLQVQSDALPVRQSNKECTFALRANLLRWATLTPDLGIEWRINHHVGILVNGSWTSWSWSDKDRRYALWKVSPEVRYYIGKEYRGFLGAMYHTGEFNYKFGKTGKQGDYQGGGITGGYQLELNRALSLDFHAGFGYTRAEYDKYRVTDGVRVRGESQTKNYWGINQFGVTLVWLVN